MLRSTLPSTAFALALLVALPALAQDQPAPATPPAQPALPPANTTDGRTVTNPNLTVASVKLDDGYRASKVIGSTVYNDQNQQVGTVDDIVLNPQNQAVLSVISVGGFLGVGGKLVALPYDQLHRDNGKVSIAGASKDALAKMPSFTYGP